MPCDSRPHAVVVVAHPDDETIFFGGLVRVLVKSGVQVDVICATGEFDSFAMTRVRRTEFQHACNLLCARPIQLEFRDRAGPLNVQALEETLRKLVAEEAYEAVYTHGVWGEYGHCHHTDVCLAVHRVFGEGVFSLAGPLLPAMTRTLTPADITIKRQIAAEAYLSQSFASRWCSEEERFVRLAPVEVECFAKIIDAEAAIPTRRLPRLRGMGRHRFEALAQSSKDGFATTARPFAEIAHIPPRIWLSVHASRYRLLCELLDKPTVAGEL